MTDGQETCYCPNCEEKVRQKEIGYENKVRWECAECGEFLGEMTFMKTLGCSEVKSGW